MAYMETLSLKKAIQKTENAIAVVLKTIQTIEYNQDSTWTPSSDQAVRLPA